MILKVCNKKIETFDNSSYILCSQMGTSLKRFPKILLEVHSLN